MTAEDLNNLTKRFASEVAEFERTHNGINGGFVTGLFRKYLIESEKEIWNAAIDAAAEGALLTWKVEDWNEPIGYTEREVSSLESSRGEYFEVSKQSILKLKK